MFCLKNNISIIVGFLSLLLTASCVNESEPCPEDISKTETPADVSCRLTISTKAGGTRADHDNETDEPGIDPENYIDIDDLQLMLFSEGRNFIQYLIPEKIYKNSDGSYDLDIRIQDYHFMTIVNSLKDTDIIRFYILALANGCSLGSPWLNAFPAGSPNPDGTFRVTGTPLRDLMGAAQSTTMTVTPVTSRLLGAGKEGIDFQPQYMPMSGIQTFEIRKAALKATTPEQPFDLDRDLRLLRALAKIEVIDHINYIGQFNNTIASSPDRINRIELAGYVNKGNLLPSYTAWQGGTNLWSTDQLTSPWLPKNAIYNNPPAFNEIYSNITGWNENMRLDFERDGSAADGAPIYSCYVYEYLNPADGTNVTVSQPPYLCVTLGDNRVFTMRLAAYDDGEATEDLTELVRNHIYRYQINSVTDFKANLTLRVIDWDAETTVWDYNDNIGIAEGSEIDWTPNTYQSINAAEASVLLKQDMSPAQCKFTIAQPTNATWRAVFLPIAPTPPGAFAFRLSDGSTADYAEGILDGKEITLDIVPTDAAPPFNYSARLQIIVTLGDGRSMNADVLQGRYGDGNKFFTIKQNSQL